MNSEEAIQKLMQGNDRFVKNQLEKKDFQKTREKLLAGQKPFAVVLTCSDSRVCPEYIFDANLGEIFIVRVAGNIAGPFEIGSIEYAVEHLGTKLVLVLGHTSCGAVNAACTTRTSEGNIDFILKELQCAVFAAGKDSTKAVEENVKCIIESLKARSHIISKHAKIQGAIYSLSDGKVWLI
jgi:carbonic anhydrase